MAGRGAGLRSLAWPLVTLLGSGLAGSLLIWHVWAGPFALERTALLVRQNFATLAAGDPAAAARTSLAWLGLWALYGAGWWGARRLTRALPAGLLAALIVGGWAALAWGWLSAYPGHSLDVFDYNFRGHMLATLGRSPLSTSPAEIIPDAAYPFLAWRDVVDSYGPLWEYVNAATHALAVGAGNLRGSLVAAVTAYRLLALAAMLIVGVLLRAWSERQRPGGGDVTLLLWLWNPLALFEAANGAHNDMLMLALLVPAARLAWRGRGLSAGLLVVLAAHIKIVALLALPPLALWGWQQFGARRTLRTVLLLAPLAALLSWALFAPLGGWAVLPRWWADRAGYISASLARWWAMAQASGGPVTPALARRAGQHATVAFALALAPLLACAAQRRLGLADLLWLTHMGYFVVGAFWFQPWYVLWALPWALLSERRLVFASMISYVFLASWLPFVLLWWRPALQGWLGPEFYELLGPLPTLLAAGGLAVGWLMSRCCATATRTGLPAHHTPTQL